MYTRIFNCFVFIDKYLNDSVSIILLRNGPCLACVYRVMDARGKLGEHERNV